MIIPLKQILIALKGLRNGLQYGSKIRFVHSLVMTFLFKSFNKQTIKIIFKNAWQHAQRLGTFVFFYKSLCMLLLTIIKSRPIVSFISGFIVGGVVFGKKTPINYQIVLYLLSRILLALSSIVYEKYFPERLLLKQPTFERKYGYRILAAICWGLVMLLFYLDKSLLQESMVSSMKYLYLESEKPIKSWKQFVPYSSHK